MKELMQELLEAMVASATDELGNGYPDWEMDEYRSGEVTGLTICTEQSRDPRRSRNGGEYYGYTVFELRPNGVEVYESLSCELTSINEYKARSVRLYPVSLTAKGLERMAHLAEARTLQQVAPNEALDPEVAAVIDAATKLVSKEIGFKEFKLAVKRIDFIVAANRWRGKKGFPVRNRAL